MNYLLIILMVVNNGVSKLGQEFTKETVEYKTLLECEKGRDSFIKAYKNNRWVNIDATCVDI